MPNFLWIFSLCLFLVEITAFFLASCKNPGFISVAAAVNLKVSNIQALYEQYYPDYVCAFCVTKKPKHAKHCAYCKKCVQDYDHHCPWIKNCVGAGNLKEFLIFISVCTVDFTFHCLLGLLDFTGVLYKSRFDIVPGVNDGVLGLCASILSFFSLVVVVPVVYIQFSKVWRRFRAKRKCSKVEVMNVMVDSLSMFVTDDTEWGNNQPAQISDVINSVYGTNFVMESPRTQCCWFRKKDPLLHR